MLNTYKIYENLKDVFGEEGAKRLAEVIFAMYEEIAKAVTKEDFRELKEAVSELTAAQKRSENEIQELREAVSELTAAQKRSGDEIQELKKVVSELATAQKETEVKVKELAEAQKRTEGRVDKLEEAVRELAEAQRRTEERVEELAEAQRRTEERVEELAEAQKRTEGRMDKLEEAVRELAEAQKRTEEELRELARDHKRLRAEVGGLAMSVSYGFENEVYRLLPGFLKKNFGINIRKRLIRIEVAGKEVNIFGKGAKDGKEVFVVGEVKLRITDRKDQERAIKDIEDKVKAVISEYGRVNLIKLIVTHFARKSFLERAEREGIIVVQSFEL